MMKPVLYTNVCGDANEPVSLDNYGHSKKKIHLMIMEKKLIYYCLKKAKRVTYLDIYIGINNFNR
jgi:hypothetical protein